MAILHKADLVPTKAELTAAHLDQWPGTGSGPVAMVGSYRFDDPDGEVGIEGLIVRREGQTFHVPLTYRGAPLPGADDALVGRMQHSVLGERWVYRAAADPVAQGCFIRALEGEQQQAELEVWADGTLAGRPRPTVTVVAETGEGSSAPGDPDAVTVGSQLMRLARTLGGNSGLHGPRELVATWSDADGQHRAVIATLAKLTSSRSSVDPGVTPSA